MEGSNLMAYLQPGPSTWLFSSQSESLFHFLSREYWIPFFLLLLASSEPMAVSYPKLPLRELGNTGLKTSSVGFGASPLGSVFSPVSEEDAVAAVREAFRLGINFFDTSPYWIHWWFCLFTRFFILLLFLCVEIGLGKWTLLTNVKAATLLSLMSNWMLLKV